MSARVKNKLMIIIVMGILSITSCLMVATSSQTIQSTNENAMHSLKTSSIEKLERILDEMRVNDYTADSQFEPSACALSNESFVVAWTSDMQDGSVHGVYATVIDVTTGNTMIPEFQVNNYTTSYQGEPSVCALSSDSFAVAWKSYGQDGDGNGIYATVIDATTGNNNTLEFQVNHNSSSDQLQPSICSLSSDSFAVVWMSDGQDGDSWGIYARIFNATMGNNITAEFRVNKYTTSFQMYPSICALSKETLAVAWQSYEQDGDEGGIFATVINATTGKNITREFAVNDYTTSHQGRPSICALSNESFAVAWASSGQDGSDSGIYARVFNATTGNTVTVEFRVNGYTSNSQFEPSICALSSDLFAVTWTSWYQDGDLKGVYATVIDASTGNTVTVEFRVNGFTSNSQSEPSICALSSESFIVAWTSETQDGSGSGVYATIFGPSGASTPPGIPGYDPIFLLGIALAASAYLIRKNVKNCS